ncbi:MAG: hypothetical protein U9N59_08970 [Campylobacterota bacterium]|nr:hypothetical protein [Campylobacterota bacterium]
MGSSNSYKCKKCDLFVSASLTNTVGMSTKVLAIKCNDCNFVGDSIIEHYSEFNNEITSVPPICDECGSKNVIKWDGKCPKCGSDMIDGGLFMCWD